MTCARQRKEGEVADTREEGECVATFLRLDGQLEVARWRLTKDEGDDGFRNIVGVSRFLYRANATTGQSLPCLANGKKVTVNTNADSRAPHVSVPEFNLNPEIDSHCGKIVGKVIKT
jgi:hypothetical protein